MANYQNIIPFILKAEGGLSKDKNDMASKYPVPDGSGYHTNKGITWKVWSNVYGSDKNSIQQFYDMPQSKWNIIFKRLYWDSIKGDNIISQRIADILVNWVWGSGIYIPVSRLQKILGLKVDGVFGGNTLNAVNLANEKLLYEALKNSQYNFFDTLSNKPEYSMYKQGWLNRLNNLFAYVGTGIKQNVGTGSTLLIISAIIFLISKYKNG